MFLKIRRRKNFLNIHIKNDWIKARRYFNSITLGVRCLYQKISTFMWDICLEMFTYVLTNSIIRAIILYVRWILIQQILTETLCIYQENRIIIACVSCYILFCFSPPIDYGSSSQRDQTCYFRVRRKVPPHYLLWLCFG